MYEYFEGVPVKTVCDNLKVGVIKHSKEGDILLNETYEALGNHYLTAIMPTGVRKPKQKASVEGTVGKIATSIIAALSNYRWQFYQNYLNSTDALFRSVKVPGMRYFRKKKNIFIHCLKFLLKLQPGNITVR